MIGYGTIIGVLILLIAGIVRDVALPYYRNRHKKEGRDARTKE